MMPEPLQFVYTMVKTLAEGRFSVIITALNRIVDTNIFYPLRSELPVVWADISNAIQELKDCSMLLKIRPRVDDVQFLVQLVADDAGSDKWIVLERSRGDGQMKSDISRRGPHGVGLEDEATHQFMVVFVAESVYLRRRCFRAPANSNQGNTCISDKPVYRKGVSRRHDATVDASCEHSVAR